MAPHRRTNDRRIERTYMLSALGPIALDVPPHIAPNRPTTLPPNAPACHLRKLNHLPGMCLARRSCQKEKEKPPERGGGKPPERGGGKPPEEGKRQRKRGRRCGGREAEADADRINNDVSRARARARDQGKTNMSARQRARPNEDARRARDARHARGRRRSKIPTLGTGTRTSNGPSRDPRSADNDVIGRNQTETSAGCRFPASHGVPRLMPPPPPARESENHGNSARPALPIQPQTRRVLSRDSGACARPCLYPLPKRHCPSQPHPLGAL